MRRDCMDEEPKIEQPRTRIIVELIGMSEMNRDAADMATFNILRRMSL